MDKSHHFQVLFMKNGKFLENPHHMSSEIIFKVVFTLQDICKCQKLGSQASPLHLLSLTVSLRNKNNKTRITKPVATVAGSKSYDRKVTCQSQVVVQAAFGSFDLYL